MRRRAVTDRASWGTAHVYLMSPCLGSGGGVVAAALGGYPRAGSYVAINTPVLVVLLSTSRSDACVPPANSRLSELNVAPFIS